MTKAQKHKSSILLKLRALGWEEDRWGHFKKDVKRGNDAVLYRVKVQKTSLRLEVKVGKSWVRKSSDYCKNIKVEDNGIVIGGIRIKRPSQEKVI